MWNTSHCHRGPVVALMYKRMNECSDDERNCMWVHQGPRRQHLGDSSSLDGKFIDVSSTLPLPPTCLNNVRKTPLCTYIALTPSVDIIPSFLYPQFNPVATTDTRCAGLQQRSAAMSPASTFLPVISTDANHAILTL